MVLPQRNGYSVLFHQILPTVKGNREEATRKAAEVWEKLPQVEKDRRNAVAKAIWRSHKQFMAAKKEAAAAAEAAKVEKQEESPVVSRLV